MVACSVACASRQAEARAFFVFGDSLVDNGNNDYLATTARADSYPYGIDYPTHRPTGREQLGSEPTLPYLSPRLTGQNLLVGANFASAGIGILNDHWIQFFFHITVNNEEEEYLISNVQNWQLNIIRIYKQLKYFEQYQTRVAALVGPEQTQRLVNQALVLITLGGNDFVNNYYLVPFSARSRQFSLPDYVVYLISEYRKVLARLYELGARRVLVTGTGPLGCVPAELAQHSRAGECSVELERAASLFNPQLVQMINVSTASLAQMSLLLQMHMKCTWILFLTLKLMIACCGQGPYNGIGLCTMVSNLCPNRDLYAFWDAFHPSEKANRIIAQQILTGSNKYMNPMNLSTILALDSRT
ncbi:Li-tolerant lipase 1 [Prunus dulcis]|uniref:Li-tolerant lipase 1 n=1 Tax=Prunus dulcis TaxID=3755 RepID=A0A4Y1RQX8_PRUDU|nr:Li-tolerant lipase 1 [Prunus dulcis]